MTGWNRGWSTEKKTFQVQCGFGPESEMYLEDIISHPWTRNVQPPGLSHPNVTSGRTGVDDAFRTFPRVSHSPKAHFCWCAVRWQTRERRRTSRHSSMRRKSGANALVVDFSGCRGIQHVWRIWRTLIEYIESWWIMVISCDQVIWSTMINLFMTCIDMLYKSFYDFSAQDFSSLTAEIIGNHLCMTFCGRLTRSNNCRHNWPSQQQLIEIPWNFNFFADWLGMVGRR